MSNNKSFDLESKLDINVIENDPRRAETKLPINLANHEQSRDLSMNRLCCNSDIICMTLNKSRIVIELLAELAIGTLFTAEEHQILEKARQSTRPATLYIEQRNGF